MGFLIKNVQLEACLLLLEFPIMLTNDAVVLTDTLWGRLSSFHLLFVNPLAI